MTKSLQEYLDSLLNESKTKDSGFTVKVVNNAKQLLKTIESSDLILMSPDACPGESNNIMFLWEKEDYYLECEIFEDGAVEFFYKNRITNEKWGEDTTIDQKLTSEISNVLKLFAKGN